MNPNLSYFFYSIKCEKCGKINGGSQEYDIRTQNEDTTKKLLEGKATSPTPCKYCGYINLGHQSTYFIRNNKKLFLWLLTISMVIPATLIFIIGLKMGEDEDVVGILAIISIIVFAIIAYFVFTEVHKTKFKNKHGIYDVLPKNGVIKIITMEEQIALRLQSDAIKKGGILVGNGWLPEQHLIEEAINSGAFTNRPEIIKVYEGPTQLDKTSAAYIFLQAEKENKWNNDSGEVLTQSFNMDSGRMLWAIWRE